MVPRYWHREFRTVLSPTIYTRCPPNVIGSLYFHIASCSSRTASACGGCGVHGVMSCKPVNENDYLGLRALRMRPFASACGGCHRTATGSKPPKIQRLLRWCTRLGCHRTAACSQPLKNAPTARPPEPWLSKCRARLSKCWPASSRARCGGASTVLHGCMNAARPERAPPCYPFQSYHPSIQRSGLPGASQRLRHMSTRWGTYSCLFLIKSLRCKDRPQA